MPQMLLANGHGACGEGTAASTKAAVTIDCGFKPNYVKVITVDATTNSIMTEWVFGMTAAKGMQLKDDTTFKYTELAENGITVGDRGFVIGTGCQTNSKKYHWIAFC